MRPTFCRLGAVLLPLVPPLIACDEASRPVPTALRASPGDAKAPVRGEPETERDRVSLSGSMKPRQPTRDGGRTARVYAKALRAWIYEKPARDADRLGVLRAGASSPTTSEPVGSDGCPGGWHPIEPRGFVCVGQTATLDADDPAVRLSAPFPPDSSRKLPYLYGTVRNPGPVFARLPGGDELRKAEPDVDERLPRWLDAGGEIGAGYAQDVWLGGATPPDPRAMWLAKKSDPVPELVRRGGFPTLGEGPPHGNELVLETMRPKVGYSFLQTFLWEGRRYGLATDLSVLPTDRLRPIQGSDFHGVEIGKDVELPFAFVRRPGARFLELDPKTKALRDGGPAAYRAALALTGKQQFFRNRLHYETKDGLYLSDLDASRIDPAKRMPGWGKAGERWLDVNITKQTLVAYDGERPVFATLISTGEAGLEDHETSTATKRGIFRIHTKYVSATMSSDEAGEEFELRDVPYVQYFESGYALHGAYWHDRFGTPKSHGCINLSPEDARRLFHFTEPALPTGWHGALLPLKGTVVFVHP